MLAIRLEKLLKEQEEQIKNRDESLEKAREEIKWLREMLKGQEAAYQGAVELLRQKTILFDDAIKRLKEQETNPVGPIEEIMNNVLLWHCGKCGFYLGPNDHFCSNCGRSVKWE